MLIFVHYHTVHHLRSDNVFAYVVEMATVRGKPLDLIAEDPKYDAANVIIWGTYLTLSLQDLLRALLWGRAPRR